MSRKTSPCTVSAEAAAELLGVDLRTLYGNMRAGFYADIGIAKKTNKRNECYTYEIWKYPLFQRLGLDVNLSVEETLELVRDGKPPFIQQSALSDRKIRQIVTDAIKDALQERKELNEFN